MKVNSKFFEGDNLFITLCLTMICISSILLYYDFNRKSVVKEKDLIGRVIFKNNLVQRKHASQVVWDEVEQDSPILNEDTILTDSSSEAVISLNDGAIIELNEVSMVFLDVSDTETDISLSQGALNIKREGMGNNVLTIISENKKVIFKKGEIKLSRNRGEDMTLSVKKGEVEIQSQGRTRDLKQGEEAVLSRDSIDVRQKDFSLEHPMDNKHFLTENEALDISFNWDAGSTEKKMLNEYLFELSMEQNFSKLLRKFLLRDNKVKLKLNEGIFYWRVSKRDTGTGKFSVSETRKFSIIKETPFCLLSPSNGSKIEYVSSLPVIYFAWQKKQNASSYKLEISNNREFSKLIKTIITHVTNFMYTWEFDTSFDKSKKLYWRVKTKNNLNDWVEQTSPIYSFEFIKKNMIASPEPVYPRNNARIPYNLFDGIGVVFKWNKSKEIAKSKIIFSDNKDFTNIVYDFQTSSDFWALKIPMAKGQYYWKVKGYSFNGEETAYSQAWTFLSSDLDNLELLSPVRGAKLEIYNVEEGGIPFYWKRPDIYGQFIIEVSRDKDFSTINRSQTTHAYSTLMKNFVPGYYFWRVKLSADDNSELMVSEIRSFYINNKLAAPVAQYPGNGVSIDISKKGAIYFSWDAVKGANLYEIRLFRITGGASEGKLLLYFNTDQLRYRVTDLSKLEIGEYFWTLKALRTDSESKVLLSSDEVRYNFSTSLKGLGEASKVTTSKIKIISDPNKDSQ